MKREQPSKVGKRLEEALTNEASKWWCMCKSYGSRERGGEEGMRTEPPAPNTTGLQAATATRAERPFGWS
jgi:hypothetical protein